MTTDAEKKLTQEERIKLIEKARDGLEALGCPVSGLNAWIEEQKQLLED